MILTRLKLLIIFRIKLNYIEVKFRRFFDLYISRDHVCTTVLHSLNRVIVDKINLNFMYST
jgi:hypothetical protein